MSLRRKRKVAIGTRATIDIASHLTTLHLIGMATIRRQFVDPAHDQLPFLAMGLDTFAKQLVGNQVRDFVGHGLFQEVLAVFTVQLWVETQQVLVQMRDTGLLPTRVLSCSGMLYISPETSSMPQSWVFPNLSGAEWSCMMHKATLRWLCLGVEKVSWCR